jgi:hypothetical protein
MQTPWIRTCFQGNHEELDALFKRFQAARQANAAVSTLGAHNEKEEAVMYPAIDDLLRDPECANVLAAMKRAGQAPRR